MSNETLVPEPSEAEEFLNRVEELMDKAYDTCIVIVIAVGILFGMYILFRLWESRTD